MSWIYVEPDPDPDELPSALRALADAGALTVERLREMEASIGKVGISAAKLERIVLEGGPLAQGSASADQLRRRGPGFEVRAPGMDLDE